MADNMTHFYSSLCEENAYSYGHDDKHLKILSDLYTDDSHFIYEILQNAEDAGASEIAFMLYKDRLEILHNGRTFNEADVRAITKIAFSTKESDVNTVGKFGLGFKSVYSITDTPEIHSGRYDFNITRFIYPTPVEHQEYADNYTTLFILPFKEEKREDIYKKLGYKFQALELKTILFLTNILSISWKIYDNENIFTKQSGTYLKENNLTKQGFKKITCLDDDSCFENWIVFSRDSKDGQFIEIAFKYDERNNQIVQATNTDLVVLFPTEKETGLNFIINGNFQTTPARDNVPTELEHNKKLICCVQDLLKEIVPELKNKGLMNISLMKTLPTDRKRFNSDKMAFFRPIYDTVKNLFKTYELIPTTIPNIYAKADEVVYARASELLNFFTPNHKKWLTTDITHQNKNKDLHEYLSDELGMPTITPEQFCRTYLSEEFLSVKSDDWLKKLYAFLIEQPALWRDSRISKEEGLVRNKPIIRLENNALVTPNQGAFLPTGKSDSGYKTVKYVFVQDDISRDFLTKLGLTKPNAVDALEKDILAKYNDNTNISNMVYLQDIQNILSFLRSPDITENEKCRIKSYPIIKCQDGLFRKPADVYINSERLKTWFTNQNRFFASDVCQETDWRSCGINFLPKIIKKCLKGDQIPSQIKRHISHNEEFITYDLDGLQDLHITEDNAAIVANIIYERYKNNDGIDIFKSAKYSFFYYTAKESVHYTEIYNKLQSVAWVLTNDGTLAIPKNISVRNLDESVAFLSELPSYMFSNNVCDEAIKMIESTGQKCFITKDEAEAQFIENALENYRANIGNFNLSDISGYQEKTEDCRWSPEININNVEISTAILAPISETRGNLGTVAKTQNIDNNEKLSQKITKDLSASDKQKIGTEGEEYVRRYLKEIEHFAEDDIMILNTYTENSTGRDIEVKKNGKLIKHIEVKSTTEAPSARHIFEMSGKQWASARKYLDKYWLYCVFGVGKKAKIVPLQNPLQLWRDGQLEAHPVNIVIGVKN